MTKGIISIVMAAIMYFTSLGGQPDSEVAAGDFSKTSQEIVNEMGDGWNLGNTMEAWGKTWMSSNSTVYDYEKAWGQPTTTKEIIDGVKAAGFNSVRIPVAWSQMMSEDGKYTIHESYFKRVKEIVGYVLDNDMYAIVNIHWDGGWWSDFGDKDQTKRENAMKKYKAMWTQISSNFKNYSEKVIFESANEEFGDTSKNKQSLNESYRVINTANQAFVDIVRSSGGNNDKRYLLIAGYSTDIDKTCDDRYIMPTDKIENHLMISVHYYSPSTFCIAETEDNSWGYMDSWGTKDDIAAMKADFEKMKKFCDAGYGVIIGEYGVAAKKDGNNFITKTGTDKFFKYVLKFSEEMGYCSMLWDCNQWYKRTEGKITDSSIAVLYKK